MEKETTIFQLAGMVKKIMGSSSQTIFVPYDDLYGSHLRIHDAACQMRVRRSGYYALGRGLEKDGSLV